jgi:hypothetical protein
MRVGPLPTTLPARANIDADFSPENVDLIQITTRTPDPVGVRGARALTQAVKEHVGNVVPTAQAGFETPEVMNQHQLVEALCQDAKFPRGWMDECRRWGANRFIWTVTD